MGPRETGGDVETEKLAMSLVDGLRLIGQGRTKGFEAVRDGRLKTFRMGRKRMVTRKALEEYVALLEREEEQRKAA
jgi:hypothetical protein